MDADDAVAVELDDAEPFRLGHLDDRERRSPGGGQAFDVPPPYDDVPIPDEERTGYHAF